MQKIDKALGYDAMLIDTQGKYKWPIRLKMKGHFRRKRGHLSSGPSQNYPWIHVHV
jgi:hypothetical protein